MVAAAQLFDESRIILQGSDTLLVNRALHVVNNGNETATWEVDFLSQGTHNSWSSLILQMASPTLVPHTSSSRHFSFQWLWYFFFFFAVTFALMITEALEALAETDLGLANRVQISPFGNKITLDGESKSLHDFFYLCLFSAENFFSRRRFIRRRRNGGDVFIPDERSETESSRFENKVTSSHTSECRLSVRSATRRVDLEICFSQLYPNGNKLCCFRYQLS